jgi:tyrosinase
MATIDELHTRTIDLLTRPPNDRPVGSVADAAPAPVPAARLVLFFPPHQEQALELARRFMDLANRTRGEAGLEAVLDEAEAAANRENMELVKYALMVFITHHPEGRRLPIPALDERYPQKIIPSSGDVAARGIQALGALGAEARLDYFREDTALNDHHNKWHVVYPARGQPNPRNPFGPPVPKDRQGELFWYMHQQMLARYDHERRAFGLPLTEPLQDYRALIGEGYDANLPGYSHRAPDDSMRDLSGYTVAEHEKRRDRLFAAAESGFLVRNGTRVPITPELLGATMEAAAGSVEPTLDPLSFYGQHHNFGHVLIAALENPAGPFSGSGGVMGGTDTAIRDPVFFRWHRHVDDIFFQWQQTLEPNDLSAGAAKAIIRKRLAGAASGNDSPDIIPCLARNIPGAAQPGFDGAAFGMATFGGAHWDDPPSSFAAATDTLNTTMREEAIRLPDGRPGRKPYLDHEEFVYFLRVENTMAVDQDVTVRIFLVATEQARERRMWIEMDKFVHRLGANERAVIYRPARHSSVVRKPARRPSEPRPRLPPGSVDVNYCDCGWPYHLLLPRGTDAGMPFRLLVLLTDWQADLAGAEKKCGSMSFCGARDALYPDRRRMGYPFDRPFRPSIAESFEPHSHIATRDIRIVHR